MDSETRRALQSKADRAGLVRLQQQVKALSAALTLVNAKTQRTTVTVDNLLALTNTDVTVTWPTPWPDTAYGVYHAIISGGLVLGTLSATLKSKTTDNCVITVRGSVAVTQFFVDVLGART